MPSLLHEALLLLFRNRPELGPELLIANGLSLPEFSSLRSESADLGEATPTEYRADAVLLLTNDAGDSVLALAIEVQLAEDPSKRRSWPVYEATLHARHRCPALVLVVSASDEVARWCAKTIAIGPSGSQMIPVAVGPAAIPIVTDAAVAERAPELSVLSAMAHGRDALEVAMPVAVTALAAAVRLDDDRATLYQDLIESRLSEAARAALEAWMEARKYEYQGPFARKYFAQGRVEGEAQGRAEGEAQALLTVLAARGIHVSAEGRATILSCRDLSTLEGWIRKAVNATRLEEVF